MQSPCHPCQDPSQGQEISIVIPGKSLEPLETHVQTLVDILLGNEDLQSNNAISAIVWIGNAKRDRSQQHNIIISLSHNNV